MRKVYFLIEGMYLQADSIAYDLAFQWRTLRQWGIEAEIFAGRHDPTLYPNLPIGPLAQFERALTECPGLIVYHWVDGWRPADDWISRSSCPTVIRWHNNTPPWFFGGYGRVPTQRTVRGYLELLDLAQRSPATRFWTNSEFSRRQLGTLGIDEKRLGVVFPASHPLEYPEAAPAAPARQADGEICLLFVGRIVPHKGHLHVLAAASVVQERTGRKVRLVFPGRPDPDMLSYLEEVHIRARQLGLDVETPGEISSSALNAAYRDAHVFVGLSEHEGFGLPTLEAMLHQLPVVGYRNSAVAEVLCDHPLACDELDPTAIAARILVAISEDESRAKVVDFQNQTTLPRFSKEVIAEQFRASLSELGVAVPGPGDPPVESTSPAPETVEAAVRIREKELGVGGEAPFTVPRDLRDHYVTRYDLSAYRSLLNGAPAGDLKTRAIELEFSSHRSLFGPLVSMAKKFMLVMNEGLVRVLDAAQSDTARELARLEAKVDLLTMKKGEVSSSPSAEAPSETSRSRGSTTPEVPTRSSPPYSPSRKEPPSR